MVHGARRAGVAKMKSAATIWVLASLIGRCVHGAEVVPWERVGRIAQLLCMTAAHESGLVHRRQIGFDVDSEKGAFSLWQVEKASICDSLKWLGTHALVRMNLMKGLEVASTESASALGGAGYWSAEGEGRGMPRLLRLLQEPEGDVLGCALARLHYIRFPSPIPEGLEAMARMAKEQYNTGEGKATAEKYLSAYRRLFGWMDRRD